MSKEDNKMDPKVKAKWLKALRSGEYDQTTGSLCSVDDGAASYCCLGVLHEVVNGEDAWSENQESNWGNPLNIKGTNRYSMPSAAFLKRIGLRDLLIGGCEAADELAHLNDSGKSFKQIANIIEKKL